MRIGRHAAIWVAAALLCGASGSGSPAPITSIPEMRAQFSLRGLDGREVTQGSYPGRWLLVYFGYTFCPDVCPTVLVKVGQVLDSLGPLASRIQPIFITVDPARDTTQHLRQYLTAFNSRIVGLRGDASELAAAARQFHVYYRERSVGNGDYAVDHSSYLYVIAPDGRLIKVLPDILPQAQMTAELQRLLQASP
jgi:cytochrome oxidase Cu insertion factor (SCO1/SenC/PrrC family)